MTDHTQIRFENGIITTPNSEYIPDSRGVGYTFFTAMSKYKDRVMQIDGLTGDEDTYGAVLQRSIRVAMKMQSYGVTREDIITVCSLNHLDVFVPVISTMFLGAKLCCFDPLLALTDAINLFKQIDPKLIFVSPRSVDFLEKILKVIDKNVIIVVFGDTTKYVQFSEFLQPYDEESSFIPIEVGCLQDTALICFSSGTTGLPKGFCISHQAYLGRIGQGRALESCYTVVLTFATLYWASSSHYWGIALLAGSVRIVLPAFDVHHAWLAINKYKPTFMFASSFQMASMCSDSYIGKRDTSSFKTIALAGSAVFEQQLLNYRKMFPTADVFSFLAATEVGYIGYFPRNTKQQIEFMNTKLKSVGTVLNGTSHKVVDLLTGQLLGPYQEGELRIKSTNQFTGYLNVDASHVFDSDGWVKTGDFVYFDDDFYFYHTERTKELIKFRMTHISPKIIEEVLLKHPKIEHACVIGKPHENDLEHPIAVVVLKKFVEINGDIGEDIIRYVDERLEDKYKLRGGVKILDGLPLTMTGKVDRRTLKKMV